MNIQYIININEMLSSVNDMEDLIDKYWTYVYKQGTAPLEDYIELFAIIVKAFYLGKELKKG